MDRISRRENRSQATTWTEDTLHRAAHADSPNCMAFSSVRRKLASVSLMTSKPASFSMALIHLLAEPCGSMQSGHLRPAGMPRSTMLLEHVGRAEGLHVVWLY